MTENYYFAEGRPFCGRELERLKAFLKERGLDYDERITHTVCIMDEDTGEIAATGSLSGIVLKCVAVSESHHGQGLLNELMTKLYEIMFSKGTVHFVGFTKPKNLPIFSHMGLYPIVSTDHIVYLENRRDEFSKYLKRLSEKADRIADEKGMEKNSELMEKLREELLCEEIQKCADAGSPETDVFKGYLIPAEDIPDYFISDKENSMQYRQELFLKLKLTIAEALSK